MLVMLSIRLGGPAVEIGGGGPLGRDGGGTAAK